MLFSGDGKIEIRSFEWFDLLHFYRSRHQVLCLDTALELTQGGPTGLGMLRRRLSFEEESEMLVLNSNPALIGQMRFIPGDAVARLAFILPADAANPKEMQVLLEALAAAAGGHGAMRVLAEVDELNPVFECLRRVGFSVNAWQRIWAFSAPRVHASASVWRPLTVQDINAVKGLYQQLVPPLAQAAEAFNPRVGQGLIYRQGEDVMAYVHINSGSEGVYLLPLIHPAVEKVNLLLGDLLQQPRFGGRRRYIVMRSYQAWLEAALCEFDGEVTPRQALLVKYLTAMLRQAVPAGQTVREQGLTRPVHTIKQG